MPFYLPEFSYILSLSLYSAHYESFYSSQNNINMVSKDHLARLAEIVQHPDKWEDSTKYFLDHFASDQEFMEMGKRTRIDVLLKIMGEVAKKVLNKSLVRIENPQMYRVKSMNMIHGSCTSEGWVMMFVYFTNIHKGVFSTTKPFSNQTGFSSRVTALPMPELDNEERLYGDQWNMNPN